MEQPIHLEFQFTKERYQHVTREMLRQSYKQKWLKIIGLIMISMVVLLLILSAGDSTSSALTRQWPTLLMMAAFWLGMIYFLPKLLVAKQPFPEPHPMRYTFTDAEVHLATATSESTLQWTAFIKAEETKEWLLLFQSKAVANAVLKSALSSGDLERLREMLRAKGLMK